MHCDDRALHELGFRGWNFIARISHMTIPKAKRVGYAMNWKLETELFKKIECNIYQEIEELRRICCTEAERARQLRIDELSTQEEESKSTVDQFMAQIQELQDKVNSPSDAREFYDPETVRSSGLLHVPSQPVSIPSRRGLACSLLHRTHVVHQETFLKVYLHQVNEPTASRS